LKRWVVIGVVAAIGLLAVWRSLTLYSNVDPAPTMDPRELALTRQVLTQVLVGDSAGAVRAGAEPPAVSGAVNAARGDSAMVRGWSRATETHDRAERGDTVIRTWFTTAAMQHCSGPAELTARLVHDKERTRLISLNSHCVPVAPIIFEVQPGRTR
jgi:hypothetical protein